jgi:hypothetical protein
VVDWIVSQFVKVGLTRLGLHLLATLNMMSTNAFFDGWQTLKDYEKSLGFWISGVHTGGYEEYHLLGYDAV